MATKKSKKTNYLESLMNFSKNMLGAGLFSAGVGFKYAGLIAAIVITTVEAAMITHGVQLLAGALEFASDIKDKEIAATQPPPPDGEEQPSTEVSFAEMAKITIKTAPWTISNKMANGVSIVVQILIGCQYIGNTALYLVFVGKTMRMFVLSFGHDISIIYFILIVSVPMGLLAMMPNLKWISKVSFLGNLMVLITYIIANYYLIMKLMEEDHEIDINYVGTITEIPILFGILLFSFETVAVIFPMRCEMADPKQLKLKWGIINIGFLVGFILNMEMGIVSYLAYGNSLHDTILIDLPSKEVAARVALITVSLQIVMTYPISFYIGFKIIFAVIERRHGPLKHPLIITYSLKICIFIISLILAEAIPYIDLMISYIGCIAAAWLTLFLGPFLNIVINKPILVKIAKKLNLTKNIIIMICAIIFFSAGFASNTVNLVKEIQKDYGSNSTK